jgi:O-antigen biosynthesis protein WbqV
MMRYFMTISEAVSLVLQASAYGASARRERGRILVLDMGQPVRVLDIARQMIRMAGYSPDHIKIEFIGLRPGEKLQEDLFDESENLLQTEVPGILSAQPSPVPLHTITSLFEELSVLAATAPVEVLKERIRSILPGYHCDATYVDSFQKQIFGSELINHHSPSPPTAC